MGEFQKFSEVSRAKVNLNLHLVGKRADGYHYLDSLVAFPDVGDQITVESSDRITFKIVGRLAGELSINDNLVLKAVELIKQNDLGASIILDKDIPISAGLGGGSSNSAVVLKILSKLWNKPLPEINKQILLGADVPVCLSWNLQRMQGVGENLEQIKEPPAVWIALVNLGEKIPTSLVFNSVKFYNNDNLSMLPDFNTIDVFIEYLLNSRNDLEAAAIELFPQIENLLAAIKQTSGCLISRMSGSGATCFGLYIRKSDATKASKELLRIFPESWIKVAKLFS